MQKSNLTSDEAMQLLVELIKRLFADNIPQLKQTELNRRFEKDMFQSLRLLAETPGDQQQIAELPLWTQRLIYEMLGQYVMFYSLQPGIELPIPVSAGSSVDEKLTQLLNTQIIPNSWPYPQSVPF